MSAGQSFVKLIDCFIFCKDIHDIKILMC